MAVLTRLDALAASQSQADEAPRVVAEEFEAYVDAVCAGGDHAAAFLEARCELPDREFDEENIIRRAEDYARTSSPGASSTAVAGEGDHAQHGGGDYRQGAGGAEVMSSDLSCEAPAKEDSSAKEETRQPKIYSVDYGWGLVLSPEQIAAHKRVAAALEDDARQEGTDSPQAQRRREEGRGRASRRSRRRRERADADVKDLGGDEFAERFNRGIPHMLQASGLEGEIDPDLLRMPLSTDPIPPEARRWPEGSDPCSEPPAGENPPSEALATEDEWQPSTSSISSHSPHGSVGRGTAQIAVEGSCRGPVPTGTDTGDRGILPNASRRGEDIEFPRYSNGPGGPHAWTR